MMDDVFKALADPVRREILDILRKDPGMNVNELSERFEMSRYGVMKHLRVLESANLVVGRKEWKEKKLYLNAIPIKQITDRWISKFEGEWASRLHNLKNIVEEDN